MSEEENRKQDNSAFAGINFQLSPILAIDGEHEAQQPIRMVMWVRAIYREQPGAWHKGNWFGVKFSDLDREHLVLATVCAVEATPVDT